MLECGLNPQSSSGVCSALSWLHVPTRSQPRLSCPTTLARKGLSSSVWARGQKRAYVRGCVQRKKGPACSPHQGHLGQRERCQSQVTPCFGEVM